MKCKTLFLTLLASVQLSSAQTIHYFQDFENASHYSTPSDWSQSMIYGDSSVDKFQFFDSLYFMAPGISGKYALFDSYNAGDASKPGTYINGSGEIVYLTSPVLDVSGSSNLYLNLDYFVRNYKTRFRIDISINSGNSWTSIWVDSSSTVLTEKLNLDISSYISSTLRVRLVWYNSINTNSYGYLAFDNFTLLSKAQTDLALQVRAPKSNSLCAGDSFDIEFIVSNNGLSGSAYELGLTLDGLIDSSLSIAGSALASGASYLHRFRFYVLDSSADITLLAFLLQLADSIHSNDTVWRTFEVMNRPETPDASDRIRCGIGTFDLYAVSTASDSVYWFEDSTGNNLIHAGPLYKTPIYTSSKKVYAESCRETPGSVSSYQGQWRFSGSITGGCYFEIQVLNDLVIDSIYQHFAYARDSNLVKIFIRQGSYRGFESNAAAWTLYHQEWIGSDGFGKYCKVDIPDKRIFAGETWSFFVAVSGGNTPTFKDDSFNFKNEDLILRSSAVSNAEFTGTVFQKYSWDGIIKYRTICSSARAEVLAEVVRRPEGLTLDQGPIYIGQYRMGSDSLPDIVFAGSEISYTMPAPSGYSWLDYGSKWLITQLNLTTIKGSLISPADTQLTSGTSSSDGMLLYRAPLKWGDSLLLLETSILDLQTGCDTNLMRFIRVAPKPQVTFIESHTCENEAMIFTNLSSVSSGNLEYTWRFGDGDSSHLKNPVHQYSQFGTYDVQLQVRSDLGYLRDTSIKVEVYELPVASFTHSNACLGKPVSFQNKSTLSAGSLTYFWEFGDSSSSDIKNPFHFYPGPGNYIVSLRAISNGCASTAFKTASQFPVPTASYSSATQICSGQEVEFNSTSTIDGGSGLEVRWRFNNELSYQRSQIGLYSFPPGNNNKLELIVISQFGCTDTLKENLSVLESPRIDFDVNNLCDKSPSHFTFTGEASNGTVKELLWNLGDGFLTDKVQFSHQYPGSGIYELKIIATDSIGCSAEYDQDLYVASQPLAFFEVLDSCSRSLVRFNNQTTNTIGLVRFRWSFGDGDSSLEYSPKHLFSDSLGGNYVVSLVAEGSSGCSSDFSKVIQIYEQPNCEFSYQQEGLSFQLISPVHLVDLSKFEWTIGSMVSPDSAPSILLMNDSDFVKVMLRIETIFGCNCEHSIWLPFDPGGMGVGPIIHAIQVYPNPANDLLYFHITDPRFLQGDITVYSSTGELLLTGMMDQSMLHYGLDISELAAGTYLLRVQQAHYQSYLRFIVLR